MDLYSSTRWSEELSGRLRDRFATKVVCITAGICAFMVAYFHLLHHPEGPVFEVPATALDRRIPFGPEWVVPYFTLWFYMGIGPGLQRGARALVRYGIVIGALCGVGLLCFRLWPTRMPYAAGETGDFPGFALLRSMDASGNACPSMHVAISIFTLVEIDAVLRFARAPATLRMVNALWCAAIVYSTLATRQHGVWDVLAGAALGGVFAFAASRGPTSA